MKGWNKSAEMCTGNRVVKERMNDWKEERKRRQREGRRKEVHTEEAKA